MRLSVFSGMHRPCEPFVLETYRSLCRQEYADWEWILVPNGGAAVPAEILRDRRVRIWPLDDQVRGVGQIKAFACERAGGEVLVELDADDLLTPDALGELAAAFEDPAAMFAYSNDCEFHHGTWEPHTYSSFYGWESRPVEYEGHELLENVAWEPGPQMMRFVYWAPDHVRAWRASAYRELGGHNVELAVADDHELLCRTYLAYGAAGMRHVDKPLYLYRIHGGNTVKAQNADIQAATRRVAWDYSQRLAERWARDEGLRLVDLGGGLNGAEGYETVDRREGADIVADLDDYPWPLEAGSVGVLRASHVLEHLYSPVDAMNEAYRVLAPGGWFFVEVPSTDGRGAFQDPGHRSFWNENSFWYYTTAQHAAFVPEYRGRFQASIVETHYPGEWWRANNIPVVRADLIALKPPYDQRPPGGARI